MKVVWLALKKNEIMPPDSSGGGLMHTYVMEYAVFVATLSHSWCFIEFHYEDKDS
jgi:hypothetical protein